MSIPYRISPKTISVTLNKKPYNFDRTHANAEEIIAILKSPVPDLVKLEHLLDHKVYIAALTAGQVDIGEAGLRVSGVELNNYVSQRIMEHFKTGVDVSPMLAFVDRVVTHPLPDIAEDIYKWCEVGDMPFTAEGKVIAFKKVRMDYCSYHASPDGSHLLHPIGGRVDMPKEQVNKNRNTTCSTGLHFCSFSYLNKYQGANTGRILIVAIDPHDIMAIPTDYNQTKGRASGYEIIGELPLDEAQQFFSGKLVVEKFQTYESETTLVPPAAVIAKVKEKSKAAGANKTPSKKAKKVADKKKAAAKKAKLAASRDKGSFTAKDMDEFTVSHKNLKKPVTYSEVAKQVAEKGQSGASRHFGVPRTTIQEWLKKFNQA